MLKLLIALCFLLLGFAQVGCAATIAAPGASNIAVGPNSLVGKDLIDAASIADQAVAIGALPRDDPLPVCLHDALQKLGIEAVPGQPLATPPSFEAKAEGVISAGVILYLQLQRLKMLSTGGGLQIDPACYAIIGRIAVDGMRDVNRAALPLGLRVFGL
jgi:hypothetical protein